MSSGNCWLLGKLSCQARRSFGGSGWNVGRHLEFTNVYKAAQQGNGRVGGGGKPPLAAKRRQFQSARRPCALYPRLGFAATFIRGLLAYCERPASAFL